MLIRVYYEDTDCGNVVYYANYLKYMERSRTELLREHGISILEYQRQGILFAVVEAKLTYHAPARYDDLLDVQSSITGLTAASLTIATKIHNQKGTLLVSGAVKLACVNHNGKACRIPAGIAEKLRVEAPVRARG